MNSLAAEVAAPKKIKQADKLLSSKFIMPISSNASYVPTMDEFSAHFSQCNAVLGASPLIIRLPDDSTINLVQFDALRTTVQTRQLAVQDKLINQQIARAIVEQQKTELLDTLNGFNQFINAYYQDTRFLSARPDAPGITEGQERFSGPLFDAMLLWEKVNAGPAPAGVTLPVTLPDGTTQGSFASAISALQFAYLEVKKAGQAVTLARADRDLSQARAYAAMKCYRQAVPIKLEMHPELVSTMPALTPAPGHTPVPVQASGVLLAPNQSKVVYTASTDPTLDRYQLRGSVGDTYDEQDAVVIATNYPGDPLEFITTFGLTQPGAEISLKVFVVLTTGNESGSATITLQRPALILPLAA